MSPDEIACEMRAESVRGLTREQCKARRVCFRCGGPLTGRQEWWCSQVCIDEWSRNHEWTAARHAAVEAAEDRCQRCGHQPEAICGTCRVAWPCGKHSRLWRQVRGRALEVNHRTPLVGRGYDRGCVHHQANLEPLCHDCHVAETTAQIRSRMPAKVEPDPGLTLWDVPA